MFDESCHFVNGYPFAIGIINLAQDLVDLLNDGYLRHLIQDDSIYIITETDTHMDLLMRYFFYFFSDFHQFWMSSKQPNIMNFNSIRDIYIENVKKKLRQKYF